jgi:hypothetical protein
VAAISGLITLTIGSSVARAGGSTDIYRNEFAKSFGTPSLQAISTTSAGAVGSTDIWKNEFGQSFGPSRSASRTDSAIVSRVGSTDIYSNEFQKSFGTN